MENKQPVYPEPLKTLLPPPVFYEDGGKVQIENKPQEGELTWPVSHIHFPDEGGILAYHEGDRFPSKGFADKDCLRAADSCKGALFMMARILFSKPMRYFLPIFFILPKNTKDKIVRAFVFGYFSFTANVFGRSGTYWNPKFMCTMAREIYKVGMEIAGEDLHAIHVVKAICNMLEFDDGWRYRVQDLMGEIDPVLIKENMGKELKRIFQIALTRGGDGLMKEKFKYAALIVPYIVSIKSVRNTLSEFFEKVDLSKLALDEMDLYRCLVWGGWDFAGIDDKEKVRLRLMIDTAYGTLLNKKVEIKTT